LAKKGKRKGGNKGPDMKRSIFILIVIFFAATGSFCASIALGGFGVDKTCYSVLSISADEQGDVFSYSGTVNANLSNVNYGLESIVVNSIEYDDGTYGARYAPLEGFTLGYGLLVNDLDTTIYQPSYMKNEKCALRASYSTDDYLVEGFGTYSHLYGVQVKNISLYGLQVGFECMSDASQESTEAFGRCVTGAFVELPLSDGFSLFAESATSANRGEGTQAGAIFDQDLLFVYTKVKVAAVSFSSNFIPGYFTSGYDIMPVDIPSLEAKGDRRYGTAATLDMGILGLIGLNYSSENYKDGGNANSGSIIVTPFDNITLSGSVKELSFLDLRSIHGKAANLVGGSLSYELGSGMSVSVNYIKAPDMNTLKAHDTSYAQLIYSF
jgi:hypothetical protein